MPNPDGHADRWTNLIFKSPDEVSWGQKGI